MTIQSMDSEARRFQPQVLLAEDLRKSYGQRPALRGLSFSLKAGRVLGFLGPNGAGKTTSIRILTTILEPSSGHFTVAGIHSYEPEKIRQKIGVLPENLGFPKNITGHEYLTFFGELYGLSAAGAKAKATELLEEVGLATRGRSLVGTYSHGMRQRLGIARTLVNDPVVVFLDEPTLGLDPRGQQELLALVQWVAKEQNVGVILCSHLLSEVESVCDDVIILSSGQVVANGTAAEVIGQTQRNAIRVRVPPPSIAEAQKALEKAPGVMSATSTDAISGWVQIEVPDPAHGTSMEENYLNNGILQALIGAGIPILGFEAAGGRLQDVFLKVTEKVIK
jgi:ABC-2 type transport system ATP-binding protein